MKKIFVFLLCIMTLTASKCTNEDDSCHYDIQIKNNSANQIVSAIPIRNAESKCKLDGKIINNGSQCDYRPFNFCIENSLGNNATVEIYIVDPVKFNDPNVYYNCDSIEVRNKVLKHYTLTLNDLKQSNFTITYP